MRSYELELSDESVAKLKKEPKSYVRYDNVSKGNFYLSGESSLNLNTDFIARYTKKLGSNISLSASAGAANRWRTYRYNSQNTDGLVIPGGRAPEYHVVVDPLKLAAANLGISDVTTALEKNNLLASAGMHTENYTLYLAVVDGRSRFGGSQFLNSTATGRYADYVAEEIVPALRARYAVVKGGRAACVIAGVPPLQADFITSSTWVLEAKTC